jgi:hypothetical protein
MTADSQAQSMQRPRSSRVSDYRPTFSPYLDLLRTDGGVLPNYFQFVRPQQRIVSDLQRQDRALRRNEQAIRSVERRVNAADTRPTGVGGGYFNFSHFYPGLGARR